MEEINETVYDKAVKLLAMRLHTTGELYRKLKMRGFRDFDIRVVLRKLEEQRFLDDERFAQIFVDNLKRYKDFGYYGIKARLLKRQIPSDLAEKALAEFFTLEDELIVAHRVLNKLSARGGSPPKADAPREHALGEKNREQSWAKLARAFENRGFRSEITRKVLG